MFNRSSELSCECQVNFLRHQVLTVGAESPTSCQGLPVSVLVFALVQGWKKWGVRVWTSLLPKLCSWDVFHSTLFVLWIEVVFPIHFDTLEMKVAFARLNRIFWTTAWKWLLVFLISTTDKAWITKHRQNNVSEIHLCHF